jgi:uncharacterized protein
MKIWFDTTSTPSFCMQDCARGSRRLLPIKFPLTLDSIQGTLARTLRQRNPLYIQSYDEHWLVCDPTGSGRLAVLDTSAFLLLEEFRTARKPLDVMQEASMPPMSSIEEAVALLYALGFLQDIHQPISDRHRPDSDTLTVWLHVTNACNLRCQYCYVNKTNEHMSANTAYKAVDAVFRSALKQDFQRVRLKYAGGEASLHLARVIDLHDYALSQAQQYGLALDAQLLSNGVILSQASIDQLKARQIGVTISLDGIGAAHDSQRPFVNGQGSFRYVDRTLTRLLANDVIPHITVTVSQRNLAGLPDVISYILERELPFTLNYYRDNECSTHIRDLQFADEQMITSMRTVFAHISRNLPKYSLMDSLLDKADFTSTHQHTCGVGRNYLVIDQRGGVAKCQADIKHTVTTIERDDPLQAVRDDLRGIQSLSVDEKEGCRTCEWRYWCTGGCPLLTYRATGRYDVKSPNCNIYKALFPEVLRLEALRLLKYVSPVSLEYATKNL